MAALPAGGSGAASAGAASGTAGPACHRLRAGAFTAVVVPETGGALAAFYSAGADGSGRHDWLRPADDAASLHSRSAGAMASFPLVPWCNRIRDGRFEWQGRHVALPANVPGSPHTLHGIGWQRPWQVEREDAASIELSLSDDGAGPWPFPFRAVQRYVLGADGLHIEVALHNTGRETMPAGIGHHPYFPHRREGAGTRVTADVAAIWLADAELMPTALSSSDPTVAALRTGMHLAEFALDNNFTGYHRHARIDWPDGSALAIRASEPLGFMVLYSPAAQDVFVLEAVSNCTDWINLLQAPEPRTARAETVGGTALAPGEVLRATTRLLPLAGFDPARLDRNPADPAEPAEPEPTR